MGRIKQSRRGRVRGRRTASVRLMRWMKHQKRNEVSFVFRPVFRPSNPIQGICADSTVERMMQDWNSVTYSFYRPIPKIEIKNGRRAHLFECFNKGCKSRLVRRFVEDSSTGNLRRHAEKCWGAAFMDTLSQVGDKAKQREMAEKYARDGTITASFERTGKGKVTYSLRHLTKEESRYASSYYFLQSSMDTNSGFQTR